MYKKLVVLTNTKLVACLLASDFPCASSLRSYSVGNPFAQIHKAPYTHYPQHEKSIFSIKFATLI